MPDTVIKLNSSKDAKSFSAGSADQSGDLIHAREFAKVSGWINERINRVKNSLESIGEYGKIKERPHEAITILGTRGSGKTSFLLSLIKYYEANIEKGADIALLKIIDPTLIEEKGHVFLTIISCIKTEVDKVLAQKETNPADKTAIHKKKIWREKLKNLAHGLPSMDGVGRDLQNDTWQDAEFIMDKGIRQVSSASKLEDNFHDFIRQSLDILGKKCFLLSFDDIDIDFRKGWGVLETIRKYMTSPHIIVVLSGDMRLFSIGIRKQQWKNFGKALLVNEGELQGKLHVYNERVTEMESQYLQKVMKPERRVHLTTIFEKLRLNGTGDLMYVEINGRTKEIKSVYSSILSQFGIFNYTQQAAYLSFLLNLPLRTQIQFLAEYENNREGLNVSDAFLSYLYEEEVDIDQAITAPRSITLIILNLLMRKRHLAEGYQLHPISSDMALNGSLAALSFLFSKHTMKSPFLIMDHIIKIGYVYNLYNTTRYPYDENMSKEGLNSKTRRSDSNVQSIDGLIKYAGIDQGRELKDIAARMTAYVRGGMDMEGKPMIPGDGVIILNSLQSSRRRTFEDRIDSIFKEDDPNRVFAFLPLTKLHYSFKRGSVLGYSVYGLLGAIGELLRELEENGGQGEEGRPNIIDQKLPSTAQLKTYLIPEFDKSVKPQGEEDTTGEDIDEGSPLINPLFSPVFIQWYNKYPGRAVAPHLIAKISTRFFNSLNKIEEATKNKYLGEIIHSQLIAFMNAVLIEELREHPEVNASANFSNTVYSDRFFIENLRQVVAGGKKARLKLSLWLLSNPLFIMFLNIQDRNGALFQALNSFVSIEKQSLISIFDQMNQVPLHNDAYKTAEQRRPAVSKLTDMQWSNDEFSEILKQIKADKTPLYTFTKGALLKKHISQKYYNQFGDNREKLTAFRQYLKSTVKRK